MCVLVIMILDTYTLWPEIAIDNQRPDTQIDMHTFDQKA